MPDAPKDEFQPLSASERGRSSVQAQAFLQKAVPKSNNAQSAALQGATLAFTTQGKQTTKIGLKPGTAVNTNDSRARKAAVLAGEASKTHVESQDAPIAGDVKGRIKQFWSPEPIPISTSQPSLMTTNPQHVAAHLAVGRSASRTTVHHTPKHTGKTIEQKAQSLGGGNCTSCSVSAKCQIDDGITASLTYGDSMQSNDEQFKKNKIPLPASMQQFRPSTPSRIQHGHDEAANPRTSTPPLGSQGDTQKKPALPPRNPPPNVRNPVKPVQALPSGDTNIPTATGVVHARKPPLPMRRSQSNMRAPTMPSARDALDNARVASSLASSRASVPAKATPQPHPPLLPPHRRTRSRSLLLRPAPVPMSNSSRSPSPPKSLRQTMRVESKSDNENERQWSHRSRTRLLRPNTHKHSEGGRKRWRDKVTEHERKRYEGVWAANKGLLLDPELQDMVVNVVVRDIWSRSRLSPRLLGCIWDLVSHDAQAMALSREEFVVGMWLIDQSLQGRKLPWKVSDSAWDSVRQWSMAK